MESRGLVIKKMKFQLSSIKQTKSKLDKKIKIERLLYYILKHNWLLENQQFFDATKERLNYFYNNDKWLKANEIHFEMFGDYIIEPSEAKCEFTSNNKVIDNIIWV
jgi:hypothetical protein